MRVALMHLPKTGGTTLHRLLAEQFEPEKTCPERFNAFDRFTQEDLQKYDFFSAHMDFHGLSRVAQPAYTITLLREPKARILSLYYFWKSQTREQIEKLNLAGPRFAKNHNLLGFLRDMPDNMIQNIDNSYVRNLMGRVALGGRNRLPIAEDEAIRLSMRNLMRIDTVGFLEDLPKAVDEVFARLSKPAPATIPKTRARETFGVSEPNSDKVEIEEVTPEIDALLTYYTRLDSKVYDAARRLFA